MKLKRSLLFGRMMFIGTVFSLTSCDKEAIINTSDLPNEISTYIAIHFPDNGIMMSVKEREGLLKGYDIWLTGDIRLIFNEKGMIRDIDGNSQLPQSVIPEKLLEYTALTYPLNVITDWELEGRKQQIELDNGLGLVFKMNGEFVRIDA